MSLLTLERSSPSPHESEQENEDLLSTSSYEGFVARDHYALCLTPRPIASLGPGRRGDHMRIFSHLKKLVKLLRPADKLKLAVELENTLPRKVTKYIVVIITHGNQETDETIVLGTEQDNSNIRIGLVLPLWRDTQIKLDGDGGFSVHTGDRQHVFKPLSVQSMWTALQTLYKCTEHARLNNYYVGGLSHAWMRHYSSRLTTDGSILNEW